jgi:hypothetical protein
MIQALISEAEAGVILKACSRTLRKARQTGRLPFVKIGRTICYTAADLNTFIESSKQCLSTNAKALRIGNMTSPSMVLDFAAARDELRSGKPQSGRES